MDDRLVEQPKPTDPTKPTTTDAASDPAGPVGFDAATSKEHPEKGSKDRQVFVNADGSETTRFYSDRQLFQDASGGWQKIDSDLVSGANGRWTAKADDRGKSFAVRADAASLASVEVVPGKSIGFSLRGAAASPGQAEANRVRYNEVRPGADLKIEANPLGIKETIILKSADAPTMWEFPLTLDGTTAELVGREVQFVDASGVLVGRIPPGFMTDSNVDPGTGDAPRSEGVDYELIDGGQTLRVSVDEDWLAEPGREFPVFVDPSVTSVESNGDTYVMAPFTNDYSGESELKVGTYDGGAHKAAALLRFSMSGLTNHKVTAATLNLRATHSYSCSARDVVIRPLTESWTVSSNKSWPGPSWGSEINRKSFAAGYSSSCADKWVNFDVTNTVNAWTHGTSPNYGLRVGADATDTYAWKKFASANSTNAPYLSITHTPYWADYSTPTNIVMPTATSAGSAKVTVTNRSTETWTPASHTLNYRIWDTAPNPDVELTASSYLLNTSLPSNVAVNGSVALTAGIQKLPPGNYRVQFDMVKTGVTRFSVQGSPMASPITINISAATPTITSWSPNAGFQADTRTPTLVATGQDPDSYPSPMTYQFKVTKPDGVTSVVESAYGPAAWTVPAGKIEWGKGYLWFVRATDGANVSTWSPGIGLSAKVGQPAITSHLGGSNGGLDPGVGNFTTSALDAMVTVVGPDLAVQRTYNSLDPRADRAFGAGWSTAWDTALMPDGDGSGNILATFADGQQARFGLNTDGTYATPPGQQGTLVATAGGGWTLRDVGDVRYRFDADGALLSITDASGHIQALTRDPSGHVTRATDQVTGRFLDFEWTGAHVTKVTTGPTPALSWTYTYSGDTLIEACDPEAACTTYGYTPVPQQRTVLLDANPAAYWRLNDASGTTAASAVPGIWRDTDGTRSNSTAGRTDLIAGSGLAASKFNGTSSKVTLPTGLVQGAHLTVEMWFNTSAPGALFGAQNWVLGAASSTQSSPTLYVGADGKLRGLFPNGTTTPMTSAGTVTDGEWHHVALTGAGATQSLYLDGDKVATLAGQINWQSMTSQQIGAAWTTGAVSAPATGASYFDGDIAEVAFFQRPLGDDTIAEHFAARDGAEKLTTVTEPGHTTTTSSLDYDPAAERVQSNLDANGGTWRLGAPVTANAGTSAEPDWRTTITVTDPANAVATYVYDPMRGGQMMSLKAAGDSAATTYAYDTGGFPFQITDPNGHVTELRHDERGNEISRTQCRTAGTDCYTSYRDHYLNESDPLDPRNDQVTASRDERSAGQNDDTYATTYTYYANGELDTVSVPGAAGGPKRVTKNVYTDGSEAAVGGGTMPAWLLKSVSEPGNAVTSFAYRSNGDLANETDPAGLLTEYEYDGIGRTTAETVTSGSVPAGARATYAYDGASRVTEELEPAVTNVVTGVRSQEKTTNTWRPDGEMDKVVVSDALGTATRTTDFAFDDRGRETSVTEADGAISRVTYDQFGQAATRTDPGGTVWSYTYTGGKRQLATTKIDEFTGGASPVTNLVVESRAYDPGGRLSSVTDAMGNTVDYKYFDDDLLQSETLRDYADPNTTDAPRPFTLSQYTYTGTGAVKEFTEGDGRYTTRTAYDPGGRPVSTTDLDGETVLRSTVTTFDDQDNPTDVIERGPAGGDLSHSAVAYDPLGRETQRTDYLNGTQTAVVKTVRDERGLPTKIIDAPGNIAGANPADFTTTIVYDDLGQQTTVTAPPVAVEAGGGAPSVSRPVTLTGYDAFSSPTHTKDSRGNVTVHGFDKVGRETSTRLPDYTAPGESTPLAVTLTKAYDALGRVTSSTDGTGATTTFDYDEFGDLLKQTDPSPTTGVAGAVATSTYTPTGWPLTSTDPTGAVTSATWDQLGRQSTRSVTERQPTAQVFTTKYSYDTLGNPAKVTTPTGLVTTFEHDDQGNPTEMTDPAGVVTTASYDGLGRPTRIEDPRHATTVLDYDLGGRVIESRDLNAAGTTLRTRNFTHNLAGNPLTSTDGAGGLLTRTYDALGQLRTSTEKVSDTKSITTSFGYDAAGNISRVTDGNNHATTYTTNVWGLPESTVEPATTAFPNLSDRTFSTAYDKAGRVSTTLAPGGVTTARAYDGAGRLTNETGAGSEVSTPARTFSYDAAGRMLTADAGTSQEAFTYTDRGMIKSATGAAGATTYTWDGEGRAASIETGAGTTAYTYGSSGRLTGTSDPLTEKSLTYSYDTVGRVASADAGTSKHTYGYDNFGRLAGDTLTAGAATTASISYGYDLADRLTSKTTTGLAGSAANTYGYDKAGRLTSWNNGSSTVAFGWDDAGNLTSRGDEAATFNERNQITSRGGVSFAYSARGTLTSRTASGATSNVAFDAFGQLVTDGSRTNGYDALHRLISAGGKSLEYVGAGLDVTYDGDRRYTYGLDGGVLGVGAATGDPVASATLGWTDQHTDLVGSVNATTGAMAGSRTFDPFGTKVASTGVAPALGFQHQFTDPTTGNVSMGARWYQPDTGTFASRDAASLDPGDIGNSNRYAYAGANPLTQTDPEGYFWGSIVKAVKKVAKKTVSVAKEVSGYNDLKGCVGGSMSSCAWFVAGFTPVGKIAKAVKTVAKTSVAAVKTTKVVKSSAKVVSNSYSYTAKTVSYVAPKVTKNVSRTASRASAKVSSTSRGVSRAAAHTVTRAGKAGHAAAAGAKAGAKKAAGSTARAGGRAAAKANDSVGRAASQLNAAAAATKARAKQWTKRGGARTQAGKGTNGVSNAATVQPKVATGGVADDALQSAPDAAGEIAEVAPSAAMPSGGPSIGSSATRAGADESVPDGVIYLRTDSLGGKPYIGQAKSHDRYIKRQREHARDNPEQDFDFEIVGRAMPGDDLDRMEEYFIRIAGGPTSRRNPDGVLANKRHEMRDGRYQEAGGDL